MGFEHAVDLRPSEKLGPAEGVGLSPQFCHAVLRPVNRSRRAAMLTVAAPSGS